MNHVERIEEELDFLQELEVDFINPLGLPEDHPLLIRVRKRVEWLEGELYNLTATNHEV